MAADGHLPEIDKMATKGFSVQACWFYIMLIGSPVLFCALLAFILDKYVPRPPRYSVAIDAVSGLDPATDLGYRPTLNPVFSLTLRVASVSREHRACVYPGMYVEVIYRGISLASSATASEQLCAGPKNATEQRVVARGSGVAVPGSMLDSLAADMRSGVQVFRVSLRDSGDWVLPCWTRRVGDAGDLRKECAVQWYSQ